MRLTFLKAAVPLSKSLSFNEREGTYTVNSYPMAKNVTSSERGVACMVEFRNAIVDEGMDGKCLLFGSLDRPLYDESRAGHAVQGLEHEWIVFDFDKVNKPPTMEGAMEAIKDFLPECVQRAQCVIQLSPSCYLPNARKLSAHVFMRLNKPQPIEVLKNFLVWINFTNPELYKQIKLTDSANSLSFALDRCVADPSRLIYIAPPRTNGFEPPFTAEDACLHFDGDAGFDMPQFNEITREQQNDVINELRAAQGLERREFRTVKFRGHDVFKDVEQGKINDVRSSGNGFIRFNINDGDSHAYWINLANPELIGNFKGEPYLMTKEVDPDFYKALTKATKGSGGAAISRLPEAVEVLAFYATNRSSTVYIGTYDRANDRLRIDRSGETAARAWLMQYGLFNAQEPLPHYDLTHDISSNIRYEQGYPVINLYERTNFIKQYAEQPRTMALAQTMEQLDEQCPSIMLFLRSMTGDARSAMGFVNWLAFIFQNRIKTGTAWLLWGTEGTGKGKFFTYVLKPLFGEPSTGQLMMSNVDKQFNSLLEGKLLVSVDEAEMSKSRDKTEAMAKFRNWITEPTVVINEKQVAEREIPSFCNFIFNANSHRPVIIPRSDRRFHVATRQEERLYPTPNQYAALAQGEELPAFADILGKLQVDEHWVRNPEYTEQKARLFDNGHNLADAVAVAIKDGDSSFFFEARPSHMMVNTQAMSGLPLKQYDDLLMGMHTNNFNVITHEDLWVLFQVVINNPREFPDNQTHQRKIFTRYGLTEQRATRHSRMHGRSVYGSPAPNWKPVPDYLLEIIEQEAQLAAGNVTPIRK